MPRTTKNSSFASAMTSIKGGAFEEARKTKDNRGSFEKPEIEDGTYVSKLVSARCGIDKNSNGYAAFDFQVSRGDYEGIRLSKFHSIAERGNRTIEQALSSLFIDLQRLLPQEDFTEFSAGDVEEIISRLDPNDSTTEEEQFFQIGVKNNGNFINIFINKLIEEEHGYGTEEEDELIPEKGDNVFFQAPRTKTSQECSVTSVNESKGTANLKRTKDGKTFKDVSFDHLEWE